MTSLDRQAAADASTDEILERLDDLLAPLHETEDDFVPVLTQVRDILTERHETEFGPMLDFVLTLLADAEHIELADVQQLDGLLVKAEQDLG